MSEGVLNPRRRILQTSLEFIRLESFWGTLEYASSRLRFFGSKLPTPKSEFYSMDIQMDIQKEAFCD